MGRVVVSRKEAPSIDWSELESRLQEISNPSQLSSSELPSTDIPIDPLDTFVQDPPELTDEPAPSEPLAHVKLPMIAQRDPLETLAVLAANPSKKS